MHFEHHLRLACAELPWKKLFLAQGARPAYAKALGWFDIDQLHTNCTCLGIQPTCWKHSLL